MKIRYLIPLVALLALAGGLALYFGEQYSPDPLLPVGEKNESDSKEDQVTNTPIASGEEVAEEQPGPACESEPTKPAEPIDPDAFVIKGRIVWETISPHAKYAKLSRLRPSMSVYVHFGEDYFWLNDFDAKPAADGSFSSTWKPDPDEEYDFDPELLLSGKARFVLTLYIYPDGETDAETAEKTVLAKVSGRTIDFGDFTYSVVDFHNRWTVTGRLLDANGKPLARQDHLNLVYGYQDWPFINELEIDDEGYFTLAINYPFNANDDELRTDVLRNTKWQLEFAETDHLNDYIPCMDGVQTLHAPELDFDRLLAEFGDIKLNAAVIEFEVVLSAEAKEALEASPKDTVFACNVSLSNGGIYYDVSLRHNRVQTLCAVYGTYYAEPKVSMCSIQESESELRRIVYTDEEAEMLPYDADEWVADSVFVSAVKGESTKVTIEIRRARSIFVHVNTPDGKAKFADFELEDLEEYSFHSYWDSQVVRDRSLPYTIMPQPGHQYRLTVYVKGFKQVTTTLPATGNELTITLKPATLVPIKIKFSGQEPEGFPEVYVRAWQGPEQIESVCLPEESDIALEHQLAEGKWTICVYRSDEFRFSLCNEVILEVAKGGKLELTLPKLKLPYTEDNPKVLVGDVRLKDAKGKVVWPDGETRTEYFEYCAPHGSVVDGRLSHHWTKEGADYTLRLPERIRLRLPQFLMDQKNAFRRIYCNYGGGSYKTYDVGSTTSLWAPPGPCKIELDFGSFQQSWDVEIKEGLVVILEVRDDFGTLKVNFQPGADDNEPYDFFNANPWLYLSSDSSSEALLRVEHWGLRIPFGGGPAEIHLPAGKYVVQVPWGPAADKPLRIEVSAGGVTVIDVTWPDSVPTTGRLVIPLPKGCSGHVFTSVSWVPTQEHHLDVYNGMTNDIRGRVVDGKLLLDGLLVGVPLKIEIDLTCATKSQTRSWRGYSKSITLADGKAKETSVNWVEETDE